VSEVRIPFDLRVEPSGSSTVLCLATGTHECRLGLPLEDCETLRDRVVWLVRVRWWVVLFSLLGAGIGLASYPADADWLVLVGLAATLGAFNAFWQIRVRHGAKTLCGGVLPFASYQILTDFVLLGLAVHYTGGVAGPLTPLFILHGVFSAVLLPRWHTTLMIFAAVTLLLASVILQQGLGWLPPWRFADGSFRPEGLETVIRVAFLGLATVGATAIGLNLSGQVRSRHKRIAALARELEGRNAELQRLDEQRVRLLGVASHDLRSPLAAIESRLDLFLAGYVGTLSENQREHLLKVKVRLGELRSFVEDLLDFTAVESQGSAGAAPQPVDVAAQLREAVAELEPLALEAGLRLNLDPSARPAFVLARPSWLALVWSNLLSNAIKYGGGNDVTVTVAAEEGAVRVRVIDHGIGMSEEDRARLFTEFFRAASVRAAGIPGTGLGLAIARRVVDSTGGSVSVASDLGKGTTFTVTLPLLASQSQS
jgi:signal transduction histidine kinase